MRMSDELKEFLSDVFGIIEANDYERQCLWDLWHESVDWQSNNDGYFHKLTGTYGEDIWISLQCAFINGKRVLFWYPSGRHADYTVIDNWLDSQFENVTKTDASNSHIVIHRCENGNSVS